MRQVLGDDLPRVQRVERRSDASGLNDLVRFDLAGKTRSLPVSDGYRRSIAGIASTLGPGIGVTIVSAGQHPKGSGKPRMGSTRHDVDHTGHSHTADLVLTRKGKPVRPGDDPQLYARLIERAAMFYPGIGNYEWGVHIGGGKLAGMVSTAQEDPRCPLTAALTQPS